MISASYKQSVCEKLINSAAIYKSVFMDFEYLIYSTAFTIEPYYIISAIEGNFSHLTGVKILVPAYDFYVACLGGTLKETDFDFIDKHHGEKSVKGTIRRKFKAFSELPYLFSRDLKAEESFSKGDIHCTIGTSDNQITLGFIRSPVRPMTLLKGNCLNPANTVDVSLVLRRTRGSSNFDTIIQGEEKELLCLISKCVLHT